MNAKLVFVPLDPGEDASEDRASAESAKQDDLSVVLPASVEGRHVCAWKAAIEVIRLHIIR